MRVESQRGFPFTDPQRGNATKSNAPGLRSRGGLRGNVIATPPAERRGALVNLHCLGIACVGRRSPVWNTLILGGDRR
jgi:hypothetical protein